MKACESKLWRLTVKAMTYLLLPLSLSLAGCVKNPVTGKRQLALVSESQEVAMGQQGAEQVRQSMTLVDAPELQAYVERLGQTLAAKSERPELPWSFQVVDDPTPNAFALPGGPIFVTRGMLLLMDSEAELASVLGHEIGHITARHSVSQLSRTQLAQLGLGLGAIFVPEVRQFGDVAGLGLNLLLLKHGRDAERQADDLGFRYARAEGYDVSEMADVFASLARAGELEGQSVLPSWLATHPAPQERVEAVEARLRNLPEDPFEATIGRAEFLGMIEGLAYGENPRNGFFRGDVFYHPDLAFKFLVPQEWKRQNLSRAVVGVSPDQDAALEFTLAGESSAAEALRRFSAQEGVQIGSGDRQQVNGVPAAIASFQATSQQGVMSGYAAFYEYRGQTYQLVAYTSAKAMAQYQERFQTLTESFAPVNDPAILNIKAPTVEIVRLPEAMTFAQFVSRFPSNVPLERLALLNQVQDVDARLSAGTLLKRVIGDIPG